jgi:MbtH protein
MSADDSGDKHVVLINEEEQYSLWPTGRAIPDGWSIVHGPATKQACLTYVEETWTDMRPKSLREALARCST